MTPARLRPDRAKYPVAGSEAYPVTRTDDFGVFIDLEGPKLFQSERFLRGEDIEVKDASDSADTP